MATRATEGGGATRAPARSFQTTEWSLIRLALDASDPGARSALADLCQRYWEPVYGFLRSSGTPHQEALDLTQGFFSTVIEKRSLRVANPERGRFRSFLLTSLRNFLSNERDHSQAQKRGGNVRLVPIDDIDRWESRLVDPSPSPEVAFERSWALAVLDRAMVRLSDELEQAGTLEAHQALLPLLTDTGRVASYSDIAASSNRSVSSVKVAVHRLRKRYGRCLRDEIASTVSHHDEIDAELKHLLSCLES